MNYFSVLFSYIFMVVAVLVSVAFMVLFERKILGYIQIRKGPNKVGFTGILQSFGDAIKLFIKEQGLPTLSNVTPFYYAPVVSLFLMIFLWVVFPLPSYFTNFHLGGLFFFCCTSFGVYALMASGWGSNSNYALLGAIRGVAQTISYEVSMALIFISFVIFTGGYSLTLFFDYQRNMWFFVLFIPLFLCWLGSILAETNRTPFDFAEGESELVSGFNIEYGSGGFALLFLAEYGSIIFMSYFVGVLFLGVSESVVCATLVGGFFCFWYIWVRGTLPRFRYDKLMYLAWKSYLPISLNFLLFFFIFKLI